MSFKRHFEFRSIFILYPDYPKTLTHFCPFNPEKSALALHTPIPSLPFLIYPNPLQPRQLL